ncbi:hypothetical protein BDZ89DRAFT_1164841 [Hymenopellis radicata]|nr:hypothetical protein BDZ89DRAFT_1164841 [Hymenopellis radicata]
MPAASLAYVPPLSRIILCLTSYLAPEVVSQNGITGYGDVVDAWSIGVIVFCMLSNSSPFDDSAGPANIRERIRPRQIRWSVLRKGNLSVNVENCIYRLSYNVIYDHSDFPDYLLRDIDASEPQGANVSAPIQRRSQVIHARIDDNKEVADVGLSPGLIANFERLTNQSANEEVAPRSLTPMAENPAAENNDVSMDVASPRKKARLSDERMSDVPATPATRGKKGLMDNVVPRRSARNARTIGR